MPPQSYLGFERDASACYFFFTALSPGGGMADAEDLKSSGVLPHGGSSPPPGTICFILKLIAKDHFLTASSFQTKRARSRSLRTFATGKAWPCMTT